MRCLLVCSEGRVCFVFLNASSGPSIDSEAERTRFGGPCLKVMHRLWTLSKLYNIFKVKPFATMYLIVIPGRIRHPVRLIGRALAPREFRGHHTYLPTLPACMAMALADQNPRELILVITPRPQGDKPCSIDLTDQSTPEPADVTAPTSERPCLADAHAGSAKATTPRPVPAAPPGSPASPAVRDVCGNEMAQGGRGAPGAGRGIFTGHDFHARINDVMNIRSY
jgi:hypothetical protein